MKLTAAKTRKEAEESIGRDWAKMVKVCGGYATFETVAEWKIWSNQK